MKKAPLVLMSLNGVAWGGLARLGWDGIKTIELQHAAGYPNTGQVGYYLVIPLLMLTVSLVPSAFLGQTRWSGLSNVWGGLTLIAVFPYLIPYGGGV
jgi:NADH:ubiquinone oxidoreductase subunit H